MGACAKEMDISRLSSDLRHFVLAETTTKEEEETTVTTELEKVLNDDTKSPLVVNRCLYRAHRNLRLAVLEASKRFEEMQRNRMIADMAVHNNNKLQKEEEKNNSNNNNDKINGREKSSSVVAAVS